MSNTYRILSLLILCTISCFAQKDKISSFIPEGYVEFEKHFEDLDKDGIKDCVLIIKKTDINNVVINRFDKKVDRNRRGIIILLKRDTNYQVAAKNYSCFESENEDGGVYYPPQLEISFRKKNLVISYNHGRYGFWHYLFRYQDSNFKLIGFDSSDNYGPIVNNETSINFLTKKKLIRENTYEDTESGDENFKETWFNIKIENLIKLSEIKDFHELDLSMFNY